ncbi:MAG: hypothetical protein GTO40_21890 [Deltaproteobacteria bacterium]|nr:hypothetical protein [Deltaproteobacteria bacterium]
MDRLQSIKDETGTLPLIPLARAVGHLPQVSLKDREVSWLRSGRQEVLRELPPPGDKNRGLICLTMVNGEPVALAHWAGRKGEEKWQLFRVFVSPIDK